MTIKEIAELAGVSSAAVSRYLNGGYLADEKRVRIARVIEQTGYRPSAQARALRSGSARIVGVIVPKINSESVSRITAGISRELDAVGYQMLLADTHNDPAKELDYLDLFESYPVDGIILAATVVTPRHRARLRAAKVPVVVLGQKVRAANCVYHDDAGAARELARRLARMCPEPIAWVGVTREDRAAGRARTDGFAQGLEAEGRDLPESLRRESAFSIESGYEAARSILAAHPGVGCISCATDTIAAGAIRAIHERGGRAGEGPLVSGFGDNQFLRAVTGGIPTVHFGYKTSGVKAVQMLMGILSGDTTVAMHMELGFEVLGI